MRTASTRTWGCNAPGCNGAPSTRTTRESRRSSGRSFTALAIALITATASLCALAIATFPAADATSPAPIALTGAVTHTITLNGGDTNEVEGNSDSLGDRAIRGISRTETTVSIGVTSTTYKTPVWYSAMVTSTHGAVSGHLVFSTGNVTLCATDFLVNGVGSCLSTNAPRGVDVVVANYSGTASTMASSGTAALVVSGGPGGVTIVSGG